MRPCKYPARASRRSLEMGVPVPRGRWARIPVGEFSSRLESLADGTTRMHAPVAGAPSYELTAGAVTTVDLPNIFAQHINCVFRNYILSWSWWRDNPPYVEESVITFVFEAVQARGDEGNDEGEKELKITERRLVTELYTAQRQRRALHMKDGFVFGALLDVRVMHMYVSYWRDGTLVCHI